MFWSSCSSVLLRVLPQRLVDRSDVDAVALDEFPACAQIRAPKAHRVPRPALDGGLVGDMIGVVAGFIVLEDGRAYAAANWATDAMLRAIGREIRDAVLREWLLSQQSVFVGMGMTSVDLREIAPQFRPVLRSAIREAHARVRCEGEFEELKAGSQWRDGWLKRFDDLAEMLRRCEVGEPPQAFNPHMRDLLPPTGNRAGPGWDQG